MRFSSFGFFVGRETMASINLILLLPLLAAIVHGQRFNSQDACLAMLERVNEPLFMPKCEKGIVFDMPAEYMSPRYQKAGTVLSNRFGEGNRVGVRIPIKKIQMPNFDEFMKFPRLAQFSNFIPMHRNLGAKLIAIFMEMRTVEDFFAVATYLRDRINPNLFVYAFSVAIMHRSDTRNVRLPPVTETFPGKFVDGSVFMRAREESSVLSDASTVNMRATIEIPPDYTATLLEPEHRLAYFREDLGINLHHWHWHLVNPFSGPRDLVQKNRRGELFYYAHQQIIGRYDFERLCNRLPRAARLQNFNEPIPEAYFPKLSTQIASRNWASRPGGLIMRDVNREADQLRVDLADLDRWRSRFLEAVQKGRVEAANGTTINIINDIGIDILGDMMEPSDYSINRPLYGDFHNLLHVAISLIHDPDLRHLETFSVVGEAATAMRDPVFYRIHSLVQEMFNQHKLTLPRYTVEQLDFQGVTVQRVELSTPNVPVNTFQTFWQKSTVDLSRGMDFFPRGPVFARFQHLQHTDFSLNIDVNNAGARRQGLVRVYLAPKNDERNRDMAFVEQRNMFIEIDKFLVDLQPGPNKIVRASRQSTVSIPFDQSFRNLEVGRPADNASANAQDNFNFCGCGWPHHMLIPKGTPEGFPSVLFVMVSNAETDWNPRRNPGSSQCAEASAYCGLRGELYPDRRPMGYPFDRLPRNGAVTLQTFLTGNMRAQDVTIRFNDRIVDNTPNNGERPRTTDVLFPPLQPARGQPARVQTQPGGGQTWPQGGQPQPNWGRPQQPPPRNQNQNFPWGGQSSGGRPPTDFNNLFGGDRNNRGPNPGNGRGNSNPIWFPGQGGNRRWF
ncbi:phenoloxidase 1-like isoform X2 [Neocloeon triangulifer]|uniref:phenoloxidase 1-like isoform X2 n=1 Tax=Neocloeon triangulifer TaxID=2078957 RepID=UPI00286F17B0|nr:phenoloxidase 1-like isoform X2 [Neocloeon triangulifer]